MKFGQNLKVSEVQGSMNVHGFSHVTINVSNLERSIDFYCNLLEMKLRHKGNKDVYLEWGNAWVCLIERNIHEKKEDSKFKQLGVDHIAFFIDEANFQEAVRKISQSKIRVVRGPVQRGKGLSINFLDPDGTELELHTSNLEERLEVWK